MKITNLLGASLAAVFLPFCCAAQHADSSKPTSLFDGHTLAGWIQHQNSPSPFSGGDITNLPALVGKLSGSSDAVSVFLRSQLDEATKESLATNSLVGDSSKKLKSAVAKWLGKVVSGPSIYDEARFQNIPLRPETDELRRKNPHGEELIRLNRMLLQDAFPSELTRNELKTPSTGWIVKEGAMASTGAGRGVICTVGDYRHYRLQFTMRHVSGNPDHQACVLIFCARPAEGEKPQDALGGIQFQVPNGGSWDYRAGHNNGGKGEFTRPAHPKFNPSEWSRVEIVADAATGTARMAVAQPVGAKAVEVLDFHVPEAGRTGPIAWQMHNAGLFDEYKDVMIEVNPANDELLTTE